MEFLKKMQVSLSDPVAYSLGEWQLNQWLGQAIELAFSGQYQCQGCYKEGKFKLYGDGFCGKCFKQLARCDFCIVKPELCHYDQGSCREPLWGEQHCNQPHIVYLANSSGLKVGITRKENLPTRWIDQGAIQALPIIEVRRRLHSGLVEKFLSEFVADKTNWRIMLRGEVESLDLKGQRDLLFESAGEGLDDLEEELTGFKFLDQEEVVSLNYPVKEYPTNIKSLSFTKKSKIGGTLLGIKGQYLIFDNGVFNVRKHSGYGVIIRS